MKATTFQSILKNNTIHRLKNNTTDVIMMKKSWLKKSMVVAISASFVFFNASASFAQMTMPTSDDGSSGDTSTDSSTTDTTDTPTDSTTDSSTDTSVVDLIENTDSEQTDPPQEDSGGGGGGSGGAILGLVAVGAVVAIVLTRKKSPKIQKTLVSDSVSGYGTQFIELSSESSLLEQSIKPQLSFQYGSYERIEEFNKPYSFFNVRASQSFGSKLSFRADAGTRLFFQNTDTAASSQWLTLGMQTKDVFQQDDRLEFSAKYSTGDEYQRRNNLLINGLALQDHESLFSDQNARFELAYSRALSQNQRLRFLLQKTDSLSVSEDDGYRAKIAWRHAF